MTEIKAPVYPAERDLGRSDERVVYLALKVQFSGRYLQLRRIKSIRAHIVVHKEDMWIKMILNKYGIDNVCLLTQRLLKNGIFDSNEKATLYFPAPAVPVRRPALQDQPHTNCVRLDQVRPAAKVRWSGKKKSRNIGSKKKQRTTPPQMPVIHLVAATIQREGLEKTEGKTDASRITFLPPGKQFQILRKTQDILEDTCFTYAQTYLQATLSQKRWVCPESAELNEWTRVLRNEKDVFDAGLIEKLPKSYSDILDSLTQLRHTAVHRIHKPRDEVCRLVTDAKSFSTLCENTSSSLELETLLQEV